MINCEREKLEFESLPEFTREPYSSTRESYVPVSSKPAKQTRSIPEPDRSFAETQDFMLPKTAELEALWPGVSHEFLHASSKRGPGIYLTTGFVAGIVVSLLGVWAFSALTGDSSATRATTPASKKIVVATVKQSPLMNGFKKEVTSESAQVTTRQTPVDVNEVIVPISSTYEVKTGDTLAGIAFYAYKRATPRLLDEICRANGMRNANVLSLGQKIVLPEYRPQASQLAGTSSSVQ